ncbi:MAG: F0F1 ATP synthase subunit epsilon [Mycoplasmatales bacterium]
MITLKIASPDKTIFNGEVKQITVKTIEGVMTILPRHIPLISTFNDGYVIFDGEKKIDIKKGFISISENSKVDILVSHNK